MPYLKNHDLGHPFRFQLSCCLILTPQQNSSVCAGMPWLALLHWEALMIKNFKTVYCTGYPLSGEAAALQYFIESLHGWDLKRPERSHKSTLDGFKNYHLELIKKPPLQDALLCKGWHPLSCPRWLVPLAASSFLYCPFLGTHNIFPPL